MVFVCENTSQGSAETESRIKKTRPEVILKTKHPRKVREVLTHSREMEDPWDFMKSVKRTQLAW